MHLSEYYQTSESKVAEDFALLAYETSKRVSSPDDQLEALKWLIKNSTPNLAKDYSKSYFKLNESIIASRMKAKNQFAKIKYDSKKATQEVIKYKNQNLFLVALLLFFLLVVVLLYFLYQSSTKRKLLKSAYQTETRISKRIHDELANDVFNVMTFTQTKDLQNSNNKESLLDTLENIYQKSRDLSKENSNIRTDENFEVDLFHLLQTFSNDQVSVIVQTKNDILWLKLVPEKKIALYRVLQELLINTKKHSQASIVVIAFQNLSKTIQIDYTDNGLGVDITTSKKTGLQNAEIRISAIQGTLTFDTQTNKGFKAKLIIPT
jgi:signal transduction histidine kinase